MAQKDLLSIHQAFPFYGLDGKHPAFTIDVNELYAELNKLAIQKYMKKVSVVINDHTIDLFHYTPKCVSDRIWNKYSLCGRSIVFQTDGNIRIVSPGLYKLFEASVQLNNSELVNMYKTVPCTITEKMDGQYCSVVIMSDGTRIINSSQTFGNEVTEPVTQELERLDIFKKLHNDYVYIFEYVQSQIVCQYPIERHGLYLIKVFNPDGMLLPYHVISDISKDLMTFVVPLRKFDNIIDVVDWSNSVTSGLLETEGVVVDFADGFGCKVKTPLYYESVYEQRLFTKKELFQYCVTHELPTFKSDTKRQRFLNEAGEIQSKLNSLTQEICEFVEKHKYITDDRQLVRVALEEHIDPRYFRFIKERDVAKVNTIYRIFYDIL